MNTEGLTPKSNDEIVAIRFTGSFGQPDGFGSVLTASVRTSGDVCLTLNYRPNFGSESVWSVMLTNKQAHELAKVLQSYQPSHWVYDTNKEC